MEMNELTLALLAAAWFIGFLFSGVFYYATYRRVPPSFWRAVAAMFWPVGIPLDIAIRRFRVKRMATRVF